MSRCRSRCNEMSVDALARISLQRYVGRCLRKDLPGVNVDDDFVKKEVRKGVKEEVKNRAVGNRQLRFLWRELV